MSLFGWLLALTYLGLDCIIGSDLSEPYVYALILVFFLLRIWPRPTGFRRLRRNGATFAFSRYPKHPCLCGVCALFCSSLIFLERNACCETTNSATWSGRLPPLELLER